MPDSKTRARRPRWLENLKAHGQTVKYGLLFSAVVALSACGGTGVSTSSNSFNRNMFAKSSFVAPKSIQAAPAQSLQNSSLSNTDNKENEKIADTELKVASLESGAGQPRDIAGPGSEQEAVEFLEPADLVGASLSETIAEASGLIDLAACTKGLSGVLATTRAGSNLLAVNGLGEEANGLPVSDLPILAAAAGADPAPSAGMLETPVEPVPVAALSSSMSATEALLISAYQQTGRHYTDGGQTPAAGFDSSGFTRWVYGQRGINLPRDIKRQVAGGRQVAKEDLRPGDLLVYRVATKTGDSYHVGIYTGQGNFLHAAAKSGVVTETAAFGPQYAPFFVGGRRYYDDPNAAPLSDGQKMAAASSAVKVALAELGPNDKPVRAVKKAPAKSKAKARKKK